MACPEIDKVKRINPKTKKHGVIKKDGEGRVTRAAAKRLRLQEMFESNAKSRLLSLPGELRNKIYEYAIGGNEIWHASGIPQFLFRPWHPFDGYACFMGTRWGELFSLSRACRQLHSETHLLPIRLNTFAIHSDPRDEKPFEGIKAIFTQNITAVFFKRVFFDYTPMRYRLPAELPELPSLKTVIHWRQENEVYLKAVTRFAEERGLELLAEEHPSFRSG